MGRDPCFFIYLFFFFIIENKICDILFASLCHKAQKGVKSSRKEFTPMEQIFSFKRLPPLRREAKLKMSCFP